MTATMRALVIKEIGAVEVVEKAIPEPGRRRCWSAPPRP